MSGSVKQVAIRLKPEGGAEVVRVAKDAEAALVHAQTATKTATEQAIAAGERQVQQLKEISTAAALAAQPSAVQQRINSITGVTGGGNARADVAARSLFAANDDMERRARAIRAEVDPLGAAVDRLNGELKELDALQKRGALSATEAAKAQAMARARYDETTAALDRQGRGLTRQAMASRLNLSRQAADVVVTAGMGMNPAMIALQQGPQILDALATSGFKAQGALLLVGGALAAAAAVAGITVAAYLSAESAHLKLERATTGLGRASGVTASELEALAITSAALGDVSEATARRQAAAYVSTGRIGAEEIGKLIAIGKDYAAVMGLDAEEATASLAKAMTQPDVAARDLTRSIGLLDQKTLDHIDSLVKLGRQQEAQAILLDALSGAVDGQADKIGGIASAWDWAAKSVSNYWDELGRALYTTPDEQIERLRARVEGRTSGPTAARGAFSPGASDRDRGELLRLETMRDYRAMVGEWTSEYAARNRDAQDDRDRRDRTRTPRGRTDNSAEREAREALQRQRREEDRAAQIDMEVARARGETGEVRRLQDTISLRQRERQLIDDGVPAIQAKARAEEEQNRLVEARGEQFERQRDTLVNSARLEADRIVGNARLVADAERGAEVLRRTQAYREAGLDTAIEFNAVTGETVLNDLAGAQARRDMLAIDEARLVVQRRIHDQAIRDRDMELARARGDDGAVRRLEAQDWIERRARRIEASNPGGVMDQGAGMQQAAREWGDLLHAESIGATRDWTRSFVQDIRQSGIRDALSNQFDNVADRFINKLIDGLFDLKIGGGGNWLTKGLDFLFGKNANGTDFWAGGPTWVGERGPELIWAPRGASISDADRSKRLASVRGAGGGPAAPSIRLGDTIIHADNADAAGLKRVEAAIDRLNRSLEGRAVAAVADWQERSHGMA